MRTCCGYGYGQARNSNSFPWLFKGQRECSEHHRSRGALREHRPYLRLNRFQGDRLSKRKENSSRDPCWRLQVHLRYRAKTSEEALSPCPSLGILTQSPFNKQEWLLLPGYSTLLRKAFANVLGSTDSHATAVHVKPASASVSKVLT